ncbi:glycine-rich domain-containing protein [Methylomonas fluvii]|uniref:Uncharacterized protein n=1 Tax=Methylomonas fluvii TaxID=1854564 RepID=A0ABR9DIK2_9GAMM|nr:hypothetical protein [Methylomonas fluvii]MBD9362897.1 hypothetical protein [Methylomonas fluvii]
MFVNEDPDLNQPPTEITVAWLNAIQEEIVAVILAAGLPLVKADSTQLLQAIKKIKQRNLAKIASSGNFLTSASITPSTVFKITLVGGGAGGGGSNAAFTLGQSGGAGAAVEFLIAGLQPNTNYAVVIGAPGAGGGPGSDGGMGLSTQITINAVVYSAGPGNGGLGTTTAIINGVQLQGVANAAVLALPHKNILQALPALGFAVSSVSIGVGPNGGSTPFGSPGIGGQTGFGDGGNASGYGAGGGAGIGLGSSGGNGSPGLFIAEWVE